ncbi:hypothetical protein HD554DRAFT_2036090 [Boletus coccyginus]|nr:hypothetical protein HD554DRAFT_2036090 [Boletus coccyginus]
MLSNISQSPDPEIRERHREYIMPSKTKEAIREAVQIVIRDSPRVLINTVSGRLLDKSKQASSFESLPVFEELISSMTTHIDHDRIQREVEQYYHYATFSHTWEDKEPLFENVVHIVVYDLDKSPTHDKLKMFCKIAREAGFHWAWSDTCCINKEDHIVLQEALVAMYKWYEGSAVTIVFLRGVHSPSRRGDLVKSHWNTRGWTFQEYHASKVVRFYTEDWKPYLNPDIPNHKESPEIIAEMEEATGVSAQALIDLRPGSYDIREKLCLASRRETTKVEDAAYSLLGIFSDPMPIIYGEGDHALGRLLARLLTSSGDTSILAWTGTSGTFNSCLPTNITVFNYMPTSQISPTPRKIEGAEMKMITARLRWASLDPIVVTRLYNRLSALPTPMFAEKRMKLPCLTFKLGQRPRPSGTVEIRTTEDLSQLASLTLVHPWIDFLLDQQPVGRVTEATPENTDTQPSESLIGMPAWSGIASHVTSAVLQTWAWLVSHLRWLFTTKPPDIQDATESLRPPSSMSQADVQLRALQALARIRQPFGALLLTPNRGHVAAYRRVTADSLITVQVEEITPTILENLVDSVHILDVV